MKNLYYYQNKVINYEDSVNGESIVTGAGTSVFVGSERECRKKVQELGLDYDGYDLASQEIPKCTPRQIRLWLLGLGVTDAMILAQINSIPDEMTKAATLIEYEYASSFERSHQFIDSVGASLGLTTDQIDEGFVYASTL